MREAAAAIATGTRASDVIGWLRPDEAIGVLLTDMRELNFAQLVSVESRIRRELATFVGAPDFRRFAVRLHVHTSARRARLATPARRTRGSTTC